MPPFGGPGAFNQSNPWSGPWYAQPPNLGNVVQVDNHGRILRIAGLADLPKPLDNWAGLFFVTLPKGADKESTRESQILVDEDLSGRYRMGGYFPGGGGPGKVMGVLKETVRITGTSATTVHLQRAVEFRSLAKTGASPRLSYSAIHMIEFDPQAGILKSAKIEGSVESATLELVQRSSVVLKIDRLDGEAAARAMAEGGHQGPQQISEAEFQKLLAEMESEDRTRQSSAAQRLMGSDLEKTPRELLVQLSRYVNSPDLSVRAIATRALAKSATTNDVPALLRILTSDDQGHHFEILQALRRLKDKRAVEPLAEMIARGMGTGYAAADALGELGSIAEDAALKLLKEKHSETRRLACQVLQKAGTSKSLPALQELVIGGNQQLVHIAAEAIRDIRRRGNDKTEF